MKFSSFSFIFPGFHFYPSLFLSSVSSLAFQTMCNIIRCGIWKDRHCLSHQIHKKEKEVTLWKGVTISVPVLYISTPLVRKYQKMMHKITQFFIFPHQIVWRYQKVVRKYQKVVWKYHLPNDIAWQLNYSHEVGVHRQERR